MTNNNNNNLMEENKPNKVHRVFENDPRVLYSYLYKLVTVTTSNDKTYTGWVKTIDPVSESVVLVNFVNDLPHNIHIVIGHTVKSIEVLSDDEKYHSQLESLFHETNKKVSEEEQNQRKKHLKSWLLQNRLPVKEQDDNSLEVANSVLIIPPYGQDQCISSNEIILGKIQGLITAMPLMPEELET